MWPSLIKSCIRLSPLVPKLRQVLLVPKHFAKIETAHLDGTPSLGRENLPELGGGQLNDISMTKNPAHMSENN